MILSPKNKRSNISEDKKLIGNVLKVALAGSMIFGFPSLAACSSNSSTEEQQSVEKVKHYCSIEEAEYFVVYRNDTFVMIIPATYYDYSEKGFYAHTFYYEGKNYWCDEYFSPDMVEYVTRDYEAAKNYASMLSDEFYLYKDVVEGNPVNINYLGDDAKVLTKNMD